MIRKVRVENGILLGLPAADPRITSYKGIPYAAPPVGENRWRAPQPCADWQGERQAYAYAPIAMQAPIHGDMNNAMDREFHVDATTPMSEDCLYLNVWAPALESNKDMPVFVWFHGGGLQVGYTNEMEFDGERIARRGIVVVSVAYRLNVFGFLCHPEITKESPEAPANFGFLDQQFALRWVQRNIAAFGGDPKNVTIGGQSAGGMSVAAQLTHKENEGLFCRAILESGVFSSPYPSKLGLTHTMENAEKAGEEFFALAGVKTLEEARKLDAVTVRDTLMKWESTHGWATTFGEAVDGRFSRRGTQEWFRDSDRIRVPLLLGNTGDEFMEFPAAEDEASLKAYATQFGSRADEFLSCFSTPVTAESIRREGAIISIEFAQRAAAILNPQGPKMYSYCFKPEMPGWDNAGAFHSSDLWFFFETLAKCWRPFVGKHYDLARQMCDYWCHFIKAGDPNGMGSDETMLPQWPAFDAETWNRMRFDETSHAQP